MEAVEPRSYLSTWDGKWTLISQGQQLCALTTRQRAEHFAQQFKITLPDQYWDGDQGCFTVDQISE